MDSMFDLFQSNDVQCQIKQAVYPIGNMIYNELYLYIWFICIYNVFLLIIDLANLFLLLRLLRLNRMIPCSIA